MVQKSTFGDMSAATGWQPDRAYNDLPRLPPVVRDGIAQLLVASRYLKALELIGVLHKLRCNH